MEDRQKTRSRKTPAQASEPEPFDHAKEKKIEYLTARQLAEVLQVSESTIHRLRRAGRIPAVMLTDRLIRFNLRDVQRALKPVQSARAQSDDGQRDEAEPSPQLSFEDLYSDFNE
ncbi:MAG TPA: helix-turn-helix domain-containing protein [Blastocatellia bacterium]|jgi:excisionase family DNA binding protein|nr:helix-turn-helix domain-containing protein [Blastocatellia bacterium]